MRLKRNLLVLALMCFVFTLTPVERVTGINETEVVKAEESLYTLNYDTLELVAGTSTADNYTGLENLCVVGYKYKSKANRPEWTSSDPMVVYVAATGRVIAKNPGVVTVTARDRRGNYLGECKVIVSAKTEETHEKDGYTYKDLNESDKAFGIVGRWYEKTLSNGEVVPFTVASGSSFYFRVTGTRKVKLHFTKTTKSKPVFAYQIDGKSFRRAEVSACNVIDLGDTKTHYVKVYIDSIAAFEKRYDGAGVGIRKVVPYSSTGVVCAVEPTNNRIAFYGDSITEGINAIGNTHCPDSCSAVYSYAGYTARRLKATPVYCGFSGTGIIRTGLNTKYANGRRLNSYTNAINAMNYFTKDVEITEYDQRVKVVVLEYGTNDHVYDDNTVFETMYADLIKQASECYPDAMIVCVVPFFKQKFADEIYAAASVNVANGVNVKVFDTTGITIRGYSDYLHPTSTTSKKVIAPKLAKFIQDNSEEF